MKNRCSRCHAKIDSHRKTCPYCGTMVRKPRGNVRVADAASSGGVSGLIENIHLPTIDGKYLLAGLLAVVAVAIVVSMLGCGSCTGCTACGSCSSCASCASCDGCASCASCDGCSSCGQAAVAPSPNGANYDCEYYSGATLYYVDGEALIALDDDHETGRTVARGKGIECVYADKSYVYYIISGVVWRAPLATGTVSGGDLPTSESLLDPGVDSDLLGVTAINGFALVGDGRFCYWGATADGGKAIYVADPARLEDKMTLYAGKYSNVQCYRGGVYFVSGDEATKNNIVRVDLDTGERRMLFEQKANYITLSGGRLIVCIVDEVPEGELAASSRLIYIDPETGEQVSDFETFPVIRGLIANDDWIYYVPDSRDTGITEVYRFRDGGSEHQLVFRKEGAFKLYGVAGEYFSLYGENVYFICNRERMPNTITIKSHTVLDKT